MIADGDVLYAKIPSTKGLLYFSLLGNSHPFESTREAATCGTLVMGQPNNG